MFLCDSHLISKRDKDDKEEVTENLAVVTLFVKFVPLLTIQHAQHLLPTSFQLYPQHAQRPNVHFHLTIFLR